MRADAAPSRASQAERLAAAAWLPSVRSLLVAFGILVVAAGTYVVARQSSIFAIERIDVEGASPDVARRVREALEPIAGSSLVVFDERDANRRLADVAEVTVATYDRDFPNTLRVVVRTERPIALLRRGRETWLVSGSARVLRQVAKRPLPKLPRVWLSPTADPLVGAVLGGQAAVAVRAVVPIDRARLPATVRSVRAVDGELTITLASGLEILLGDTSALGLKLAAAARVLPEADGVTYLDVSVPERIVGGTEAPLNAQVED